MIHVLNFSDEIIDYISANDDAVIYAEHERNLNEQIETFKFSILSKRASNLQHRNRIIIQDSNSNYREFIIEHVEQEGSYTEVECVASYLEDIRKAKPIEPMTLSKKSTHESLEKILAGTGWQTSDLTEYGGNKTTSWKNYQSRYDSLLQLKTTFSMTLDFYIELGAHTVDGRFVVLKKKSPLFKGKEVVYGKDLAGMKRTVNMSEVKTALIAQGPEQDNGNRIILEVKDDEAQSQFGLPEHYLWDIYEPQTEEQSMTEARLRTLATTELNKRKKQAVTYEVTSIDVKKLYSQDEIAIGDLVRVKDQEFNPPLYLEAEVIGEKYDLISGQSEWAFGEYVEYEEKALKNVFERKLDSIQQKLNDKFTNVNTIVKESLEGELQHFEPKILKGDTPPDNPVNDLLWLDTSNPKVAVLRRYWNGEWIKSSAENANDVGAITREQALYSGLSNTFVNLTIQHSRLIHEVSDVLESEYLVDTDIKAEVNSKLNDTISVFNEIKQNLESMTSETATIGKLIDTQALFLKYREKMQALYITVENTKIAIDERFKLLQSQYTDKKYNEAMKKIAAALPGGNWDAETGQLTGNIPNEERINEIEIALQQNLTDQINGANQILNNQVDAKLLQLKDEITLSVHSVNEKIDGLGDGVNLLDSYNSSRPTSINKDIVSTKSFQGRYYATNLYTADYLKAIIIPGETYTYSYEMEIIGLSEKEVPYTKKHGIIFYSNTMAKDRVFSYQDVERKVGNKIKYTRTFVAPEITDHRFVAYAGFYTDDGTLKYPISSNLVEITNFKLERGTKATPYSESLNDRLEPIKIRTTNAENSIKVLQDSLLLTATKTDVQRTLDEQLKPLKNEVSEQKAQLQIMSDSIDNKVSQSEYTSNLQGVVERLDNAETHRQQLSNEISDRVTLSEYNSGIGDVNQTLDTHETRLTQNGKDIALRATQEELNASKKTLSRVIADLTVNTTTGLTMTYDENGSIQSHTIGPEGIKFDTTKFIVNDGDVIIQNGITTIKDAYIDKLFSKQATIEYLKATDIDLNRATISGSQDGESTILSGGKIRSTGSFVRTFPQGSVTYEAFTESWNGVYRSGLISKQFGNRKLTNIERWLALTDKTITTQREVHSMSPDKRGARFIDFFAEETYSSDVFGQGMHVYSGQDLKIEAGYRLSFESSNSWYTQFLGSGVEVVNDGASLVLKRQSGFTSQAGNGGQYIMLQAYDGAEHGHLGILSNNRHLSLKSSFGEVHLRGNQVKALNSEGSSLTTITASDFDVSGVGRVAFENGDAYLQGKTGVRFTRYKSNTFVTAQAKDFVKASSRHLKTNIEDLKNGLETINQLKPVKYDYISDLQDGNTDGDIGFIAEDSPSISVNNGKAISVQKIATWAILGIQELSKENNGLQKQIADLKTKFDVLSEVIK
ncbi:phage tail spike protein [Staphylococcus delphini]|uniref:phage tail spike protein n=1 Tax=Staphylococcus delphini TaxID=53344 RepID=UPI000307A154|nr:phage tail spike protein [Staphylococcus delphini]